MGTKTKIQFNIESSSEKNTATHKAKPKNVNSENCFLGRDTKYQACMKFIEAIIPKNKDKNQDKIKIIDFISPVDSPE